MKFPRTVLFLIAGTGAILLSLTVVRADGFLTTEVLKDSANNKKIALDSTVNWMKFQLDLIAGGSAQATSSGGTASSTYHDLSLTRALIPEFGNGWRFLRDEVTGTNWQLPVDDTSSSGTVTSHAIGMNTEKIEFWHFWDPKANIWRSAGALITAGACTRQFNTRGREVARWGCSSGGTSSLTTGAGQ